MCQFVPWEERRSSHGSNIADNLTHNILEGLKQSEVDSYTSLVTVSFPDPVLVWMATPGPDRASGTKVTCWVFKEFRALKLFIH